MGVGDGLEFVAVADASQAEPEAAGARLHDYSALGEVGDHAVDVVLTAEATRGGARLVCAVVAPEGAGDRRLAGRGRLERPPSRLAPTADSAASEGDAALVASVMSAAAPNISATVSPRQGTLADRVRLVSLNLCSSALITSDHRLPSGVDGRILAGRSGVAPDSVGSAQLQRLRSRRPSTPPHSVPSTPSRLVQAPKLVPFHRRYQRMPSAFSAKT